MKKQLIVAHASFRSVTKKNESASNNRNREIMIDVSYRVSETLKK